MTDESAAHWKRALAKNMTKQLGEEIDQYETEILLMKAGKIDEKVFAETRLRRGAYGQRYDNGHRNDGRADREIPFPSRELNLVKGPGTLWDAPGMLRIKIPFGGLNTEQMEILAECAEEYSDGICHITTRQDFQLHYVHIEDTPPLMRRLAAVGITTREACGNTVRNVTACPYSGVCPTETFDVTPYAKAITYFLLGHPDAQDFGRKFKIAFSGCEHEGCGLVRMHDLGYIAKIKDGRPGFDMYVGGGLGTVPYQAKQFSEFVPAEEILPLAQAICRVFARLGEKKNRAKARIKFLLQKLGIDEFRRLVLEEREKINERPDPRWTGYLDDVRKYSEKPLKQAASSVEERSSIDEEFTRWAETNARPQKQAGYSTVTVALPLGDITASQMRGLADVCRTFVGDNIRTTVEQNFVLRWVSNSDLPAIHAELAKLDLAEPGAGTIVDITSCPGTDTCKLGISSSRGLAGHLRRRLGEKSLNMEQAVKNLKIKVSGCFNSCGQHHVSDIGFYGVSRKVGEYMVPHFQLLLGGQWSDNAGSYGLAVGSFPSKAVPEVVDRLADLYVKGRQKNESFQAFIARLGKVEVKKSLQDLAEVPPHSARPEYYTDWGDVREYSISDKGIGECAGEVVSLTDFALKAAEREAFDAQVKLEAADVAGASQAAHRAMVHAARGLIQASNPDISTDPAVVVKVFTEKFYDSRLFHDPFAGGKFAQYYFKVNNEIAAGKQPDAERAHQQIEEAQLFIEAAHACYIRMSKSVPQESPTT